VASVWTRWTKGGASGSDVGPGREERGARVVGPSTKRSLSDRVLRLPIHVSVAVVRVYGTVSSFLLDVLNCVILFLVKYITTVW